MRNEQSTLFRLSDVGSTLQSNSNSLAPTIGRKSIKLDQFYTKDSVAKFCVGKIDLKKYDAIIEPSAGDGAFCNHIRHPNLHALDIAPQSKGIKKQDFFDFKIDPSYEKVLVIGNPPFGIHHKLSDAFLRHCFCFNVETIAFILPDTYYKHTRQKIIPTHYRIKAIHDIGKNAFLYDGKEYHVPCSFFIIDRSSGKDLRMNPNLYKESKDFYFSTEDNFDFFMFGSNPARITKTPAPSNRGYFIKSKKIHADKLISRMESIKWIGRSCANGGVAWFSKPEVIKQYKEIYE